MYHAYCQFQWEFCVRNPSLTWNLWYIISPADGETRKYYNHIIYM
jgi:hypothetical protein